MFTKKVRNYNCLVIKKGGKKKKTYEIKKKKT